MKQRLETIFLSTDVVVEESIYDQLSVLDDINYLDVYRTPQKELYRTVNAILSALKNKDKGL